SPRRPPPSPPPLPSPTLFRSPPTLLRFRDQLLDHDVEHGAGGEGESVREDRLDPQDRRGADRGGERLDHGRELAEPEAPERRDPDRKSTRLDSSHVKSSHAVF